MKLLTFNNTTTVRVYKQQLDYKVQLRVHALPHEYDTFRVCCKADEQLT